jgi:hypothetical protein
MRFISRHVSRSISIAVLAALAGCTPREQGLAGRWQLSWRGRIGTEQAVVVLRPSGQALSGSFTGAQGSLALSGSLSGARLSFTVDFPGPPSYRILFSGVAQADRLDGKAQPEGVNGGAFAGHGGEVAPDYYTWSATRLAP